jgi:hypothetical protein
MASTTPRTTPVPTYPILTVLQQSPSQAPAPVLAPMVTERNQTAQSGVPMLTARTLTFAAPNAAKKTKGKRDPQHSVSQVLRTMYAQHNNLGFLSLEAGLASELSNQTTWVWTNIFAASEVRDQQKISKTLKLIDCLWTAEERKALIEHEKSVGDIIPICISIERRVVQAAHVLQKNPPKSHVPSRKATGGLLGLANSIGRFELDEYLPNWTNNGKTRSDRTLQELVTEKTNELKSRNKS